MVVTEADIIGGIRHLGLDGRVVCVHSSLSSFGHVDGGAPTVVAAFLHAGCTVMVPAYWDGRRTRPQPHQRYARNGTSDAYYRELGQQADPAPLDPFAIDRDMGAIPATVVRWQGACRGAHLCGSFAAVGPQARGLVGGQTVATPERPLEELVARNGALLLMGVGLNRLSILHFAEERAGRSPFRRWFIDERGQHVEFLSGGCSDGFERLAPALQHHERTLQVGASRWRCFPDAAALVASAAGAIRTDPSITHCGKASCERCRDAVLGGFLAK